MPTKTAKKKLMIIKNYSGNANQYAPSLVAFAFLDPPGKDGVRHQSTPSASCREGLLSMLLTAMGNEGVYDKSRDHSDVVVDTDRMRLVVIAGKVENDSDREEKKKRLFKAKAILNMYERYAGFDDTKISTVKHENMGYSWLFTGGRKKGWMASGALFTFACLIIRLALTLNKDALDDLTDANDAEDLTNKWKKYIGNEAKNHIKDGYSVDLVTYMAGAYEKILLLLKNHAKLFDGIDPFPLANVHFQWRGGITSTCELNSFSDEINARLMDLFEKGSL